MGTSHFFRRLCIETNQDPGKESAARSCNRCSDLAWLYQCPGFHLRPDWSFFSIATGFWSWFVGMVPIINIFFMALLFPLFTVHTTLNFIAIEQRR